MQYNIHKDFTSIEDVLKNKEAFKTLFGNNPAILLIGTFLGGRDGILFHLNRSNHRVIDVTEKYILVKINTNKMYKITAKFDEAAQKQQYMLATSL